MAELEPVTYTLTAETMPDPPGDEWYRELDDWGGPDE